jgi:hypothetical protein
MADGREQLLRDRKDRAGRIECIREAATLQLELAKISRRIKEIGLNLVEHDVELTFEQFEGLSLARTDVLNAADKLHGLASQMVGSIRRDNI